MPLAKSIDTFIDSQAGNKKIELCGKLAIVRSILEAERSSLLFLNKKNDEAHPDYSQIEKTWYSSLMRLLNENGRKDDLMDRLASVSFIVFNYDRCIEHFLFHSLQTLYQVRKEEAADLVKRIEIFHPYGTVGSLPWQSSTDVIDFGDQPSPKQLLSLANKIRTFTEGTNPQASEITSIRDGVRQSNIVVFLGFAFHKLNLDLIKPDYDGSRERVEASCFATASGMSNPDCDIVRGEIGMLLNQPDDKFINVRPDLTCYKLFNEFGRALSFF
jgi:hypothetical protein